MIASLTESPAKGGYLLRSPYSVLTNYSVSPTENTEDMDDLKPEPRQRLETRDPKKGSLLVN